MKWNEFKNRLKKDALQEEMEVDVNEIWNGIADQIEEEQPRRRNFLFWLSFAGLILMGTGVFFLNQANTDAEHLAQQTRAINELKNTKQNADKETSFKQSEKAIIKKDQSDFEDYKKEQNQTTKKGNIFSNKKSNQSTTTNSIEKNQTFSKGEPFSTQKNASSIPNKTSNIETALNFPKLQKETSPVRNISSNKTLFDKSSVLLKNNLLKSSKTVATTDKDFSIASFSSLANLPLVALEESPLSLAPQSKYFPFSSPEEAQEEAQEAFRKTQRKRIQFSLGIQVGFSAINRTLATKNNEVNPLLSIREEYEKPLEAKHYGLLFNLEHTKGWRLSTGLQMTSIAERYQNQKQQITNDSILGTKTLRVNLYGDTLPIQGMIPQTTTTTYNKKIFNTYRLFDIPLLIAYQRSFDQWQLGLEAGIFANISLKTSGIIPDKDLEDIDLKTNQSSIFNRNIGLSYHLGMTISRTLSDKMEIRFSPSARFFPKDFAHKDYELSQKYYLLGGNIGLHYRF